MKGTVWCLAQLFSLALFLLDSPTAWAEGNVWMRAGLDGLNISLCGRGQFQVRRV